jgi:hypothetical protein
MNKYDTILNNSDEFTDVKLTPTEGLAAIALITMLADRPDAEIPVDRLMDVLAAFEMFDEYSEEQLMAMIEKIAEIADQESLGAIFNAADDVEVISDDLVPDAYAIAVAASVDDQTMELSPKRNDFLRELQIALDVDDEEAKEIMTDVVATLQASEEDISEATT